jgi:hypothetical protein
MRMQKMAKASAPAVCSFLFVTSSYANSAACSRYDGDDVRVEITRSGSELQEMIKMERNVDFIDTALVFNNPRGSPTLVACVGYKASVHRRSTERRTIHTSIRHFRWS